MGVTARALSVPPIWIAAFVGAVLVGLFAGDKYLTWLPVVAAVCVLVTFAVQLALQSKEGLVTRIIASIGGVLAILAIASAVLILLHPGSLGRLLA